LKRKKQRNFITESFAFLKRHKPPQNPNIRECRGYPCPFQRGPGEIGIPRRVRAAPGAFGTFLAEKYTPPFFEKKEQKSFITKDFIFLKANKKTNQKTY